MSDVGDKRAWFQLGVGALSVIMSVAAAWTAVKVNQAEVEVRMGKLEAEAVETADYDSYLQGQIEANKERIVINETTVKFMKENLTEVNSNVKTLVGEVRDLNVAVATYLNSRKEDK